MMRETAVNSAVPGGHLPISMDLSIYNKTYMKIGTITLTVMQDP